MNIESSNINRTNETKVNSVQATKTQDSSVSFADELKETKPEVIPPTLEGESKETSVNKETAITPSEEVLEDKKSSDKPLKYDGVQNIEINTNKEILTSKDLFEDKKSPNKPFQYNDVQNIEVNTNKEIIASKDIFEDKQSPNKPFQYNDVQNIEINTNKDIFEDKKSLNKPFQYNRVENINTTDKTKNNSNGMSMDMAIENLSTLVHEFNQSEDKTDAFIKKNEHFTDNNNMINNDYNIQDNKDILPQMTPNMNFSGDGQPFSSFMNNDTEQNKQGVLTSSAQDLAEESAILSTMEENIAMANKNQILSNTKTVINEEGIKKVDIKSGIEVETVVSYDSILMNKTDVEVFTKLVEEGQVDLNKLTPQEAEKSVKISKTLADMLAKSMENNQPVRINFDNNISVIIRISRDGKITADFLPSSQVAEAYLKENLPLLRQRFDENNLDYESLNQRERRNSDKENNRKKDRNNE